MIVRLSCDYPERNHRLMRNSAPDAAFSSIDARTLPPGVGD